MQKDDIIKYLLIAGGAYAAYWYITNHGPNGAVFAADGVTKVAPSYWDSWFGTTATVAAPVVTTTGAPAVVITQSPTPPPAPPPATMTVAQLRAAMLNAAGVNALSANNGYSLTADQWNYYQNNVNPPALTGAQFGQLIAALPAGVDRNSLTVDQFLAALLASGVANSGLHGLGSMGNMGNLGDVVAVGSRPSVPMMSFGGALNPGFPSKKGWS